MPRTPPSEQDFELMDKALHHLYTTEPQFFDSQKCMSGYKKYVESRLVRTRHHVPFPRRKGEVFHDCREEKCNENGKLHWFDRGSSVKCEVSGAIHKCSGDTRCEYKVITSEDDIVCYFTGLVVGKKFSHEIEKNNTEEMEDENVFTLEIDKLDPEHPHYLHNMGKEPPSKAKENFSAESIPVSKSKKKDTENFKKPLKRAKTEQSTEKKVRTDIMNVFSTLVYNTARHQVNKLLNEEVTLAAKLEVDKKIKVLKKENKTISAYEIYQILMEQTLKKKFLPEVRYNPVQEDYYVTLVYQLWVSLSPYTQKISPSNFTLGCLYLVVPSHDDGQAIWHDIFLRDILPDKTAFEKLPGVYEGYHKKIKTSKAKIISAYIDLPLDQKNELIVNLVAIHEFYSQKIQLGPICPFLGILKTDETRSLLGPRQG